MPKPVIDDTHSDYHTVKSKAAQAMDRGVWKDRFEDRFVSYSSREMRCDLPREAIKHISEGKHYISYRGLPMAKDPFDLLLYEMLFYELKPATIIELGAYTGASALWMKDRLNTFDINTRVISVDIDLSLVDEAAKGQTEIEFVEGDCNRISDVFPPKFLSELSHPLVLIDDAHVDIAGVYRYFHQHAFREGDYLIVEDTIPWIPGNFGEVNGSEWGDWKSQEIEAFFSDFAADYRVDRYYTDFFGYNVTWNWNGFIRRV